MVTNSVKRITHFRSVSVALAVIAGLTGCGSDIATNTDITKVDTKIPTSDWKLVWSDEFDGSTIDSNKWFHEVDCNGGGNQEKQCYTDSADNSFLADGMLNIVAKPSVDGEPQPYTSARLSTKNLGDWTYGRFEMRAKLPGGQGAWPAFWMLPTDETYGGWPNSGEIDIVESVNLGAAHTNEDGSVSPENYVYGTLHYGRDWPNNSQSGMPYQLPDGANPTDDFHTYALEWQAGEIRWYMDDVLYSVQKKSTVLQNAEGVPVALSHRGWFAEFFDIVSGELELDYSTAPFDERFHILLNFAVGGSWPENVNELGIDASAFAEGNAYQVDYVRVYECAANPLTGAGCETVAPGYNVALEDGGLLIKGKAPNPPLPPVDVVEPLTIFAGGLNEGWPLWDCCGGSTPAVVADDAADHGDVAEFTVGADPTVLGFYSRDAGTAFDASPLLPNGTLSFDMKVVSAPNDSSAAWMFKLESNGGGSDPSVAFEVNLNTSNEGLDPVTGEWQTYTFDLQTLADAGFGLSGIDVMMLFPAWGQGEGAVFRVDNVVITSPDLAASPEVVIFEDTMNNDWPLWDCCGGSTPIETTDDETHGTVAEFSVGADPTVLGFFGRDAGSFDASALINEGVVQFEMKVVTAPNDSSAPWFFKIESNGGADAGGTAVEINVNTSNEGADPVAGEWQTYTFNISDLVSAGLDPSAIDVLMIFPAWGQGEGAVFRVDNVKIYNPNASSGGGSPFAVFNDEATAAWPLWDCCGGSTPTVETDDEAHGAVAEFSVGASPTVLGFDGRSAGSSFDASAFIGSGTLSFEMKVVTAPNDSSAGWLFKVESNGGADAGGTAVEVNVNTSNEGVDPVVGEWQTYTFNISDLVSAGLDPSAIDVIMIFPAWGQGEGAVYRVDNVVFSN